MSKRYATYRVGLIVLGLCSASQSAGMGESPEKKAQKGAQQRAMAGKALWEEKCKTVAGEKIYRKVENVEGIVLLKVRPQAGEREWADRMWPGAAFAREARTDEYITTFLGYEHAASYRGSAGIPVKNSQN